MTDELASTPTSNMQTANRRFPLGLILRIAVSVALIGVVLVFVDVGRLLEVLVKANPWFLIAAVVLLYMDRALMAYKWNPLLAAVKISVPYIVLFRIYLVTPVAQMFLPSTVGCDLFRLYSLSRFNLDKGRVFASMIVERTLGYVATLLLVLLSFIVAYFVFLETWSPVARFGWIVLVTALAFTAVAIVLAVSARTPMAWLGRRVDSQSLIGKFIRKVQQIVTTSLEYRKQPGILLVVFFWSFVEQLLLVLLVFLIAKSLHIEIPLLHLLAITPLTILAIRLPISLDGIGVQEGLYVALFALAGVGAAEALLLSLFRRAVIIFMSLPWVVYYIIGVRNKLTPASGVSLT